MPDRENTFSLTKTRMDNTRDATAVLLHGGTFYGWAVSPAVLDSELNYALNSDGCSILATPFNDVTSPAYTACAAYKNGVFADSFFSVAIKYSTYGQFVLDSIPLDNSTFEEITATTHFLPEYITFTQLEDPYFRNITIAMASRLLSSADAVAAKAVSSLSTLSIVFVVIFTVFSVIAYIPLIRRAGRQVLGFLCHACVSLDIMTILYFLSRHVLDTQSLILLFNDRQLTDILSLKSEVKAMLASNDRGARQGQKDTFAMILLLQWGYAWLKRSFRRNTKKGRATLSFKPKSNPEMKACVCSCVWCITFNLL